MPIKSLAIGTGVALLLCGCVTITPKETKYVQASDVINALKDELADVEANPIDVEVSVPETECGVKNAQGQKVVHVIAQFQTADVVLKTIATDSTAASGAAAKVPLGAVLLGGSFTYTHSSIRTQQVTYTLLNDQGVTDTGGGKQNPRANTPYAPGPGGYIPVYTTGQAVRIARDGTYLPAGLPTPHLIAQAIFAARDQILAIDHARKPCVIPSKVKVEVNFQIQDKTDAKADVAFFTFIDVGTESVRQREFAQSMVVTFTLGGSSASLY